MDKYNTALHNILLGIKIKYYLKIIIKLQCCIKGFSVLAFEAFDNCCFTCCKQVCDLFFI
ncbi:hypothetical protein EZS27_029923 [termite gut metagenome]|uniref:Uncharacterized protein n=1 Tax=termite gut metagenome TaxID=433724 RepID=A0A5J4QH26_9ZZZZ